jgi:hypothetical protein
MLSIFIKELRNAHQCTVFDNLVNRLPERTSSAPADHSPCDLYVIELRSFKPFNVTASRIWPRSVRFLGQKLAVLCFRNTVVAMQLYHKLLCT